MNLLSSVGYLVRGAATKPTLAGTCFCFRHSRHVLTAAHCVRDTGGGLVAIFPASGSQDAHPIEDVDAHPSADVAHLTVPSLDSVQMDPFWGVVNPSGLGEDAEAFGYPEDVHRDKTVGPLPRLFRGHYQRLFPYESHLGYSYRAGELSFPAAGGLSGGPVYRPQAPPMISGLVAENFESTTQLAGTEEVEEDGTITRESIRRVTQYGIVVVMYEHADWLDERIPKRK